MSSPVSICEIHRWKSLLPWRICEIQWWKSFFRHWICEIQWVKSLLPRGNRQIQWWKCGVPRKICEIRSRNRFSRAGFLNSSSGNYFSQVEKVEAVEGNRVFHDGFVN